MASDNILSNFIKRYVGVKIADKLFGKKQNDLEVKKNDLITDIYNELCQMHLTLKNVEKVPTLLEKQSRVEEIESKLERENNNSFFKQVKDTYISFRSTKILLNETREEIASFREENTELLYELNERFEQFFDKQELLNNQIASNTNIKPATIASVATPALKKSNASDGGFLSNLLGSVLGGALGGASLKGLLGGGLLRGGLLRGAGGLALGALPRMLNPYVALAITTALTGKQLYNLYNEYSKEGGHKDLLETHANFKNTLSESDKKLYEEKVENRKRGGWETIKNFFGFGVNDDNKAFIKAKDEEMERIKTKLFERHFKEYNDLAVKHGFKELNRDEYRKEFYTGVNRTDFMDINKYEKIIEQRKREGLQLRENTRLVQNALINNSALERVENDKQIIIVDNKTINNNTGGETKSPSVAPKVLSTRNVNNSYNRRVDYDKRFVFAG